MTNDKNTDRVISMADFLASIPASVQEDAAAHGLDIASLEAATAAYNELNIAEPRYGEEVLGTMNEEELKLFVVVSVLSAKVDDLHHELGGEALIATGAAIKARDTSGDSIRSTMEGRHVLFETFFKYERQLEAYRSRLFLSVCNRLGHWDWVLGIRSKQRIVKVERKW